MIRWSVRCSRGICSVAALFALVALALHAGRAHASDVVVMVPPRLEPGVAGSLAERAVSSLARQLSNGGFSVIKPAQAAAAAEALREAGTDDKLIADPHECSSSECALWYRNQFDAIFAVQMTIFSEVHKDARVPDSITVVLVESDRGRFKGSAKIEGGDIEAASRKAFEEARLHQSDGVGPWLTVEGTPVGAEVFVDGVRIGALPIKRQPIDPGQHDLRIRHRDFGDLAQGVHVAEGADVHEKVSVALDQVHARQPGSVAGAAAGREKKRSVWNYVIGGVLVGAGAAYIVGPAITLAKDGECSGGTCYEADTGTTIKLIAGAVGIAAGATLCAWAPIRVEVATTEGAGAMARLRGAF